MKALDMENTKAAMTRLNSATKPEALQELFTNVVFHALIHGNVCREQLAEMRDNKGAPAKFKAGLIKHMPVKWDKAAKQYNYDKEKGVELCAELGVVYSETSFEELADVLPELFAKVEKAKTEFNLADYLAKVAKKLDKEGVTNADKLMALVRVCMNDDAVTARAGAAAYMALQDGAKEEEAA